MHITVILCTYNRAETLGKALDSVAAQNMPISLTWEVLVVDNNSRDRTREVVQQYAAKFPGRFRYFFEPAQGLSRARNAGIAQATGDVIAFMDDDVTLDCNWLR